MHMPGESAAIGGSLLLQYEDDNEQLEAGGDEGPEDLRRCIHCGVGARSTPHMRRGPEGPRTLCNACGLAWRKERKAGNEAKRPRPETRIGCLARMKIKLMPSRRYRITKFIAEHNHQPAPPSSKHLLRSQRVTSEFQSTDADLSDDAVAALRSSGDGDNILKVIWLVNSDEDFDMMSFVHFSKFSLKADFRDEEQSISISGLRFFLQTFEVLRIPASVSGISALQD
ncbi:hypothetical protein M5K25_012602 [Dendrobium thyrsiflorum]|uniref:GATA-type domain-containing protein n=1 Tax=Dendrobium thyrsiflorum TaxID=117978 RepID=A0ABD0UXX8_DENTH